MLKKLVLPYVNLVQGWKKPFNLEVERAGILCLSEARRKKSSILRGRTEEIWSIAKFEYPLWIVPWKESSVIVDGLGLCSAEFTRVEIPEIKVFAEDIKRSSVSSNLFRVQLKSYSQTFAEFVSSKREVLDAVMCKKSILQPLLSLLSQSETQNIEENYEGLVPPKILEQEAKVTAGRLMGEWSRIREDVDALKFALETLGEEVERHKEKISLEIEQIWREFETRASEKKRLADMKAKKLMKEKEKEKERILKLVERRLKKLADEERKVANKIKNLEDCLNDLEKRRKKQKKRYPKRSTTQIDRRIKSQKKRLKLLLKDLHNLRKLKEDTQNEGERNIAEAEAKYLDLIAEEMKDLEVLEELRNLEISRKMEEMREIEEGSAFIEAQIKMLIERLIVGMKEIESMTLPYKVEETVMAGIPFYLVEYRSGSKRRFDVYPPVTLGSYEGVMKRVQKAISLSMESRLQMLFSPMSQDLNREIFENFKRSLNADPTLRENLSKISEIRNILRLPDFKDKIAKGLDELKNEGWLTTKEKENILTIYA